MENLLATQYQIIQSIEKILINLKKDGPERRTYPNIQRRLATLETYWNEFNSNHMQLTDYQDVDHEYFKQNFYQKTKSFYQKLSSYFELYCLHIENPAKHEMPSMPSSSNLTTLEPSSQAGVSTPKVNPPTPKIFIPSTSTSNQEHSRESRGTASKLEEMLRKQNSNFKAFSRTINQINYDDLSEKWEFLDMLKNIESRWDTIDHLHWEIDSELCDEDLGDYERAFSRNEREYIQIKKALNQKMWAASYRTHSTPVMDIPTFNGDYHRWISFKDLFTESIHSNRSMSNAQKMQFLKTKVKGEAEKLIQHLTISSENYQVCWDILNHRYHNSKLIFSSHANILMSLPSMQQQTAPLIKKIHDTANECLNAMKNLGVDISTWDTILVHILSQKLDTETHKDYIESVKNPRELPSLTEFFEFLEIKFTSLEASRRKQDSTAPKTSTQNPSFSTKKPFQHNNYGFNKHAYNNAFNKPIGKSYHVSSVNICPHCNGEHKIFCCKDFIEMPNDQKLKTTNKLRLCVNCLYDHKGNKCTSNKTCRKCTGQHNTLLHDSFIKLLPPPNNPKQPKENVNVSQNNSSEILLATAQIKVLAEDGTYHNMRALIDQGSQISLITENAVQKLGLSRRRCKGVVFGLGAQENNCKGATTITATAIHGDFTFNTNVIIMKNLINNLPNHTFKKPSWSHIENINLADPEFYISSPIDLLLGADIYAHIMLGGIIKGDNESHPMAQQTHLGWLLCGNVKTYQCNVVLNNLDDIQRFWTVEDIAENPLNMSTEDYKCVQQYTEQTTRREDGRYVVRLPMKPDTMEKLGGSKQRAVSQFLQLEKKFSKNEKISEGYKAFINEYVNLGHMHKSITDYSNQTAACYLPHHCVLRADSTTTALRVVFNASSPTSSGHSLNDLMYSGPNLQQDLLTLILRWRQYEVAFIADIEKMFRQILVHEEDQHLQKIIWRDNPNQLLRHYNLATVTYGTKSAPFLAMMTLKQLARDEGHKYHTSAKRALEEDFYMDDLCSGSHSISTAKQLQTDLIKLLKSGGFNLRKWSSNKPELLKGVETAINQQTFDFKYPESTKTLGLRWNPLEDQFSFNLKLNPPASKPLSKRILLSEISKVFDPLGWLSPVTTKLKLLFQKVWLHDVQWDSELPEQFSKEWKSIREELEGVNHIKVQRWLECHENENIELHGFCDSSIKAYACIIYCKVSKRNLTETQQTSIIIVAAKARLVPINKTITLPRLELMSCLLLSKLMETVLKSLPNHNIKVFGWTDSTAALGWLQGDTNRWKPFVANRVEQIKPIIPSERWRYVKSAENPADCASKGITVKQLQEHPLWFNGPSWLPSYNSELKIEQPVYVTDQEIKKKLHSNVATASQHDVMDDIINKHSNFVRATRVLAWVLRAVSRNRPKQAFLSMNELSKARQRIIQHNQLRVFADEINSLKNQTKIDSKSKILNLNPFIDQDGLLRVGGRIKHAHIHEDMKHPYIIPHDGHLTTLLIDQAHRQTFHGGARLSLARLRHHYWIIGGNRAVKKRLRNCVTCRRHDPVKQNQLMGDLPSARSNQSRPFFRAGVDLTGYVEVKANKGRGIKTTKGYVAVFVCMVTKAVHLELVSDLSSSAFLAALRRMAARRGAPRHVYCDNGTNFVGASRILKQEFINLQTTLDEEFLSQAAEMEIEFHFNAPSWPSAGGLWEAAVKSLKHHLRRVLGEQKLTYEEFSTLLSQLEACLNSRPLCTLTEDPDDTNYLTPAHFLASGPILTIIETERDERTRWQLTQKIFNDIWKRWQAEYLCQLSTRSKWKHSQQNQKVGDIVIIHDANLPAGKWSLGRVVELHPGRDKHVRVVSVKTKNGIIQRPIVKLSPLPVNHEAKQESQQNDHQNNQNIRSPKPKPTLSTSLKTMFITLLTTMLILPAHGAYNIAKLKSNQSVYFDKISDMHLTRDHWKLIVYYDMNPYWQGSVMLTKYIESLESICYKAEKPSLCDVILLQIRHSYSEFDHYNRMLLGQQNGGAHLRTRRGLINGVGNLAHTLFGVLDDQFAEKYQRDIELLRLNQKHLSLLWKNQTSVVEAEYNMLQRVEETMNKQHKLINQHINNVEKMANSLKKDIQGVTNSNGFALSAIVANSIILDLRKIQEYLLDTIIDLHYGSFNIHLITPEQLRDELNIISGQLSKDLSLPINNTPNDLSKLYHLLKVKAKMTEQFFIFEISIPLVARDYYEIYHLIPILHTVQDSMVSIIPISNYIAMNIQKDSYFTMTLSDLHKCNNYDDVTYLCPLQRPVYHMTSDKSLCIKNDVSTQCSTDTVPCKTAWSELNEMNTHLYSCCGQCTVRVICGSLVTAEQLIGSGIIKLSEGCIIKGTAFTIYSHRQQNNNLNIQADVLNIEIPSINHIIDLSLSTSNDSSITDHFNHTNMRSQLKEIGDKIHQMKESEAEVVLPDGASPHDTIQYGLIYIILGIIICTSLLFGWRRMRTCRPLSPSNTGVSPPAPLPALPVPAPPQVPAPPPPPPPPQPTARASRHSIHAAVQRQQTGRVPATPVGITSDDSDNEISNARYARVLNKATSPVFRKYFS